MSKLWSNAGAENGVNVREMWPTGERERERGTGGDARDEREGEARERRESLARDIRDSERERERERERAGG